jgi:hypothetical protein
MRRARAIPILATAALALTCVLPAAAQVATQALSGRKGRNRADFAAQEVVGALSSTAQAQ